MVDDHYDIDELMVDNHYNIDRVKNYRRIDSMVTWMDTQFMRIWAVKCIWMRVPSKEHDMMSPQKGFIWYAY